MNYKNVIYMYTNKINGHKYIGQTKDLKKRHGEHKRGCDVRHNSAIDIAFLKYGEDCFDLKILVSAPNLSDEESRDFLNEMEMYYIWKYNTFEDKSHYNLNQGGNYVSVRCGEDNHNYGKMKGKDNPFYNHKHSDKTKQLIGDANRGSNNGNWVGYYRVVKCGFDNGRQIYQIIDHNGKKTQKSIFKDKLDKIVFEKNKQLFRR